ncbi:MULTISPECIES: dTDP-4-dehydrorhamnose 3,5-epimerase family protein [Streptomyces]|uniref:dTDP-4-dehydrorhamnose 3,5-epimerase family protein n=1 Tax=Streptomyces TaxID=1883 RepID=UPI001E33F7C7|nr:MULTISPECIES: dTDP-4-dehydrorhamnose 3,5-epimerase family protein [Streptomyces]UFQ20401.1 dTDP-4-dehydrorhamnose 3,5-epimerase family protein [Streptomyces huasconensis]WCL90011.1 dTDP-4-dehydrorhamnose 3,5-epimerase family protein [Streptomyces sp. JCM 35825]
MEIQETAAVPGAYVITPHKYPDPRGVFFESLRADLVSEALGRPFTVRQINYSVSRRNTLRGLHGVRIPPGQAKYVTCVRGAFRDIVVDLRVGSPTFGHHTTTLLTAENGVAVHVTEGLGHGFLALTDETCISYALSTTHVPGTQFEIDPLDPELALPWGFTEPPLLSAKDARAPTLEQARAQGILPRWPDTLPEDTGRHAG